MKGMSHRAGFARGHGKIPGNSRTVGGCPTSVCLENSRVVMDNEAAAAVTVVGFLRTSCFWARRTIIVDIERQHFMQYTTNRH